MLDFNAEFFLLSWITSLFMGLIPLFTLLTMCNKKSKVNKFVSKPIATNPVRNLENNQVKKTNNLENKTEKKEENYVDVEVKIDDKKIDVNKEDFNKEEIAESISPTIKTDANLNFNEDLKIEPRTLMFTNNIKNLKLNLTNITVKRLAVKIKCSDNKLYRVKPVYSFINKNESSVIEVVRLEGEPKVDLLAVVTIEAPENADEAMPLFKNAADTNLKLANVIMNEVKN